MAETRESILKEARGALGVARGAGEALNALLDRAGTAVPTPDAISTAASGLGPARETLERAGIALMLSRGGDPGTEDPAAFRKEALNVAHTLELLTPRIVTLRGNPPRGSGSGWDEALRSAELGAYEAAKLLRAAAKGTE